MKARVKEGKLIVFSLFDYLGMVYQHAALEHRIVTGQYYMTGLKEHKNISKKKK